MMHQMVQPLQSSGHDNFREGTSLCGLDILVLFIQQSNQQVKLYLKRKIINLLVDMGESHISGHRALFFFYFKSTFCTSKIGICYHGLPIFITIEAVANISCLGEVPLLALRGGLFLRNIFLLKQALNLLMLIPLLILMNYDPKGCGLFQCIVGLQFLLPQVAQEQQLI